MPEPTLDEARSQLSCFDDEVLDVYVDEVDHGRTVVRARVRRRAYAALLLWFGWAAVADPLETEDEEGERAPWGVVERRVRER